jgi:aminopeptidase N/puromycin-sensitive aminopeptidase
LLSNPRTRVPAWEWVKKNWPAVENKITMSSGGGIIAGAGSFCDATSRDDVQQFFTAHKVPSAERTLKLAVERINSCIGYKTRQQDNLAAWLQQHPGGSAAGGR